MSQPVALLHVPSVEKRAQINEARSRFEAAQKVAFDLQSGINYFYGVKYREDEELFKFLQERRDEAEKVASGLYEDYAGLFGEDVRQMLLSGS